MPNNFSESYSKKAALRFEKTLKFISNKISKNDTILDIGPSNPLADYLKKHQYNITNTPYGQDLDLNYDIVKDDSFDVVTAFEILEHLVSPFPLLNSIQADTLIASIPLRLWFATAYWNKNDPFDCHYHEFEPRQFDMLLEKAGWEIVKSEKWTSKTKKIGFRPILRLFVPRYYIVYCQRKK